MADKTSHINYFTELLNPWNGQYKFNTNISLVQLTNALKQDNYLIDDQKIGYVAVTSYPGGNSKDCYHRLESCVMPVPNLIKQAGERSNVVVKFLLLTRNALDVVRSSFWFNNGFDDNRVDLMIKMCRILKKNISQIERKNILCLPYTQYGNKKYVNKMNTFLGEDISAIIQETYKPHFKRIYNNYSSITPKIKILEKCISDMEKRYEC